MAIVARDQQGAVLVGEFALGPTGKPDRAEWDAFGKEVLTIQAERLFPYIVTLSHKQDDKFTVYIYPAHQEPGQSDLEAGSQSELQALQGKLAGDAAAFSGAKAEDKLADALAKPAGGASADDFDSL